MKMNSLTKRLTADLSSLNLKPKSYRESWSTVTFYGKVNIRRKLRPKSAKFGSFIDFEHDFPHDDPPPETGLKDLIDLFSDGWGARWEDGRRNAAAMEVQKFFLYDGILHRKFVYRILAAIEDYYRGPHCATLVDVALPEKAVINVCGDVHGQLYDLVKIFNLRGVPSPTNYYLFNGDIVDKGPRSVECILLLFIYKLVYPDYVFLNRGNHESATVNMKHGFQKELLAKYGASGGEHFMFEFFGEIFRWMPIAHLIDDKILVVHGGISGSATLKVDDLRNVK